LCKILLFFDAGDELFEIVLRDVLSGGAHANVAMFVPLVKGPGFRGKGGGREGVEGGGGELGVEAGGEFGSGAGGRLVCDVCGGVSGTRGGADAATITAAMSGRAKEGFMVP